MLHYMQREVVVTKRAGIQRACWWEEGKIQRKKTEKTKSEEKNQTYLLFKK